MVVEVNWKQEAWKWPLVIPGIFKAITPQRSNAPRVRNMSRFNGGKLPGNSKHFFKKSKDKAVPGKRSFKLWVSVEKFLFVYLSLYRLILCFVTVFLAKLSYELRFRIRFELIQIFKALTTGCDVGFCVWPRWRQQQEAGDWAQSFTRNLRKWSAYALNGYSLRGNEKKTGATLKDFKEHLYCSHINYKYRIGRVYRATFSSVIRTVLHSVTGEWLGGAYWKGGAC